LVTLVDKTYVVRPFKRNVYANTKELITLHCVSPVAINLCVKNSFCVLITVLESIYWQLQCMLMSRLKIAYYNSVIVHSWGVHHSITYITHQTGATRR